MSDDAEGASPFEPLARADTFDAAPPPSLHYYLLTGDIGGTNSRMSLYEAAPTADSSKTTLSSGLPTPLFVKYYRNAEHLPQVVDPDDDSLFSRHIILPFLQFCWSSSDKGSSTGGGDTTADETDMTSMDPPAPPTPLLAPLADSRIIACMATAGVVVDHCVHMTNLQNLLVNASSIVEDTSSPHLQAIVVCELMNDFVAQGYGCLTLEPHHVLQLYGPEPVQQNEDSSEGDVSTLLLHRTPVGPKICVGAGTGLGECYLTPNPASESSFTTRTTTSYSCFPSEGGHVEYAPRNDVQVRLWQYLHEKFAGNGRVSVERIVSGTGLANIYEFMSTVEWADRVDPRVHAEFLAAADHQGQVVGVQAKREGPGSLCYEAMQLMMGAYGSEVGSCALKFLPTGGIFVTGGLTPKNLQFLQGDDSEFIKAYLQKGRVSPILESIPLFAVLVEDLGVRGAYKKAHDIYVEYCGQQTQTQVATSVEDAGDGVDDGADDSSSSSRKRRFQLSAREKRVLDNVVLLGAATALGFAVGMAVAARSGRVGR